MQGAAGCSSGLCSRAEGEPWAQLGSCWTVGQGCGAQPLAPLRTGWVCREGQGLSQLWWWQFRSCRTDLGQQGWTGTAWPSLLPPKHQQCSLSLPSGSREMLFEEELMVWGGCRVGDDPSPD